MLDARIVASSTQSLASAAQSPATRTDWMVPSSHGPDLTLGTRNCSSRPNSSRTLASFGLITHYLRVGYRSPAPLAMSALHQMCFVPKGDIAGSAGRYLRNCQALLASFECFYSKYRWQVARDFLPIFTFIQAREYRTTVCAEIDARRITLVTSHCLTEHSEEAVLLWQTLTHRLPGLAAVARPPDRCGCVERKTSGHVSVEWQRPDGIRNAWMNTDRKA